MARRSYGMNFRDGGSFITVGNEFSAEDVSWDVIHLSLTLQPHALAPEVNRA